MRNKKLNDIWKTIINSWFINTHKNKRVLTHAVPNLSITIISVREDYRRN